MSNARRPVLTLPKSSAADEIEDRSIDIGIMDVLLPCRFFSVTHKVAEIGRVSMTTEFLLRLLNAVDGMEEDDVERFFGFDRREMTFVLTEAEANDYVERRDGRLWLTSTGRGLFHAGTEEPQIFDVEKRTERIGFDLLALAPQERESLTPFELSLPELQARDARLLSDAASRVPHAFRRHYAEIVTRRAPDALKKRSLYSIDEVSAGDRFSSVVSVVARSSATRPGFPEPDLTAWRSARELEERTSVIESVAALIDGLRVEAKPEDAAAYEALLGLAPEFLKDFTRRDGFAADRFYKEGVSRAGEFRIDRPTIPIVGPLFTRENNKRFFDAIGYSLKRDLEPPKACIWLVPQVAWGMTRVLPLTLEILARQVMPAANGGNETERLQTIAIVSGKPARHISEAFDIVETGADPRRVPPALELLVIPQLLAAAIVHAPIRAQSAFPVPVGILSFDQQVVTHAQSYLLERLPRRISLEADSTLPDYDGLLRASVPQMPEAQ